MADTAETPIFRAETDLQKFESLKATSTTNAVVLQPACLDVQGSSQNADVLLFKAKRGDCESARIAKNVCINSNTASLAALSFVQLQENDLCERRRALIPGEFCQHRVLPNEEIVLTNSESNSLNLNGEWKFAMKPLEFQDWFCHLVALLHELRSCDLQLPEKSTENQKLLEVQRSIIDLEKKYSKKNELMPWGLLLCRGTEILLTRELAKLPGNVTFEERDVSTGNPQSNKLHEQSLMLQIANEIFSSERIRIIENEIECFNDEGRSLDANGKGSDVDCFEAQVSHVKNEINSPRKELESVNKEFCAINFEIKRLVRNYLLACSSDLTSTNPVQSLEMKSCGAQSCMSEIQMQTLTKELFAVRNKLMVVSDELKKVCSQVNRTICHPAPVSKQTVENAQAKRVLNLSISKADSGTHAKRVTADLPSELSNGGLVSKRTSLCASAEQDSIGDDENDEDITKMVAKQQSSPISQYQTKVLQQSESAYRENLTRQKHAQQERSPSDLTAHRENLGSAERLQATLHESDVEIYISSDSIESEEDDDECSESLIKEQEGPIPEVSNQPASGFLTKNIIANKDAWFEPRRNERLRVAHDVSPGQSLRYLSLVGEEDERIDTLRRENELLVEARQPQRSESKTQVQSLELMDSAMTQTEEYIPAMRSKQKQEKHDTTIQLASGTYVDTDLKSHITVTTESCEPTVDKETIEENVSTLGPLYSRGYDPNAERKQVPDLPLDLKGDQDVQDDPIDVVPLKSETLKAALTDAPASDAFLVANTQTCCPGVSAMSSRDIDIGGRACNVQVTKIVSNLHAWNIGDAVAKPQTSPNSRKSAPIALKEIDEAEALFESDSDDQVRRPEHQRKNKHIDVNTEQINDGRKEEIENMAIMEEKTVASKLKNAVTQQGNASQNSADCHERLAELRAENEMLKEDNDAIVNKLQELARQEFQEEQELQRRLALFTRDSNTGSTHARQRCSYRLLESLNNNCLDVKEAAKSQYSNHLQEKPEQLTTIGSYERRKFPRSTCGAFTKTYGGVRESVVGCRVRDTVASETINRSPEAAKDDVETNNTGSSKPKTPCKLVQDVMRVGIKAKQGAPVFEDPPLAVPMFSTDAYCAIQDETRKSNDDLVTVSQESEERLQALLLIEEFLSQKQKQCRSDLDIFDACERPIRKHGRVGTILANISALVKSFQSAIKEEAPEDTLSGLQGHTYRVDLEEPDKFSQEGRHDQGSQLQVGADALRVREEVGKSDSTTTDGAACNQEGNLGMANMGNKWLALVNEKHKSDLKIMVLDLEVKRLRTIIGMKFYSGSKRRSLLKKKASSFLGRKTAKKFAPEIIFFNEFIDSENFSMT